VLWPRLVVDGGSVQGHSGTKSTRAATMAALGSAAQTLGHGSPARGDVHGKQSEARGKVERWQSERRGEDDFNHRRTAAVDKAHGVVAAACTARGADVAASDQQLARSADSAGVRWQLRFIQSRRGRDCDPTGTLAMGRAQITAEMIFQYSNYLQTMKYKMKAILMSKNIQT
jgi:hypothetical protein